MATFHYKARDINGNEVAGEVQAATLDEARSLLTEQGLQVLDLSSTDADTPAARRPLSSTEAEELTGRIAQVSAGNLPLAPGLRAAAEESTNHRVASALGAIAAQVEQGRSLDDILADSDRLVPRHISGLLAAAARTGNLGDALVELADQQRAARDLRQSVGGGFAYPLVVVCLATILLLSILFFVAGTYQQMFEDFQFNLPVLTMVLFWWRDVGVWLVFGVVVLGLLAIAVIRLRQGRAGWLRLVATIPLFGPLWHWSGFAEWLGLLSVLVRNQIPLPEALRLAGDGVSNDHVGGISRWLADGAEEGQTVWQMLSTTRRAPNSLIPLVRWGEEKGSLTDAFCTGREMFEARVRVRSLLLQTILPPILFVTIACCAVFVVSSLFLPMATMIQGLSG